MAIPMVRWRRTPKRSLSSAVLAGAMLLGGVPIWSAVADDTPTDLVDVTPQRTSKDPAAAAETEDSETLLEHAVRNAHGEVGAMIASDGSRAVYGTVTMPIGENGTLTLSGGTGRIRYYPYDALGRCDYRHAPLDAPPIILPPGRPLCTLEEGPFVR